jgi:tetrahydromethanopterin S-methyltransferase subunit F
MKKIDYSDLDAAESIGHVFGFVAPVVLVVVLIVWAVSSFF